MIYPRESVRVDQFPDKTICVRDTASSCTTSSARNDILNITITQTNHIGSTQDNHKFDRECVTCFSSPDLHDLYCSAGSCCGRADIATGHTIANCGCEDEPTVS